jgi:phage terminase large subunit
MLIKLNSAFEFLISDENRYKVLYGGAGSGKSYSASQVEIVNLLKKKQKLLVVRKVGRTLRLSCFSLFKQLLTDMGVNHQANKIELSITLFNGSEIVMTGLDDPEKLKSISNINRVFVEEATEITEKDFNQIDLRVRGVSGPSITLCFNPIDVNHWLKKRFFDRKDEQATVIKTTYLDNAFIDRNYKTVLSALERTDVNYYKIYCLGEWGSASKGLIFNKWDHADFKEGRRIIYGLDFGFSSDPAAMVRICIDDKDLYVQEIFYKHKLTNRDIGELLTNLGITRSDIIYADSAEPKSIEELFRQGFNIRPVKKGADSIKYSINLVKSFHILVADSLNLEKELNTYKWMEDKEGNAIDKPVDYMNHAIDAMRYAVMGYYEMYPSNKQKTKVGFAKYSIR